MSIHAAKPVTLNKKTCTSTDHNLLENTHREQI